MSEIIPRAIVTYKEIYDDYDSFNLDEILSRIPTAKAVHLSSLIIIQINRKENFDIVQKRIVTEFIHSIQGGSKIIDKLDKLSEDNNSLSIVFTNINCMLLTQKSLRLNIATDTDEINDSTRELFFKALLLINQMIAERKQKSLDTDKQLSNEELYFRNLLPMYIPDMEFQFNKDLVVQSIKLNYFIEFIESDDEFKKYEEEFLKTKKVSNWDDYIKYLWLMYASLHSSGSKLLVNQEGTKISFDIDKFGSEISFCNTLSINTNSIQISDINISEAQEFDFKLIRKFPLYKIKDNIFNVVNINFLADKMFQGIQYDYCDIVEKRSERSYSRGFKDYYSDHFAHRSLFHPVMDYCVNLKDKNSKKVNGEEYPDTEYSDFYIRNRKKVFLIEFKDYVMNATTKHSYDYNLILNYIKEHFITPKGANQLVNVINSFSNGGFSFDSIENINEYSLDELIIQPIIIYSDSTFSCPCINHIVNKGFKELLEKHDYNFKIENLVMIHIDIFIKYQDSFNKNILKLNDIIMKYFGYINKFEKLNLKSSKVYLEVYTDFESFFIENILKKNMNIIRHVPNIQKEINQRISLYGNEKTN